MSRFVVMESSAHVAGKARQFGRYRNVAVVEIEDDANPKMISEHAKGVVRIVKHFGACSVGKTAKCQYEVERKEAGRLVDELNTLKMRPSDIRAAYRPDGHFFDRATMRFFGDTMKSFRAITVDGRRYMYRRPDATVNVFGTIRRVGRDFFAAWRVVPYGSGIDSERAAADEESAVWAAITR